MTGVAFGSGEKTGTEFTPNRPNASPSQQVVEEWLARRPEERSLSIPEVSLSREEAERTSQMVWRQVRTEARAERVAEWEDGAISVDSHTLRFATHTFGEEPPDGHTLWISLRGGGGTSPEINDRQWQNQLRLYQPEEGIYLAPRAPTNTWNLWHQAHIDQLFSRLIETAVIARGVNPNRVFLLGYSAGGDGVYQLAPRMADRWAAAAMMAGHPNDASPLSLRNLPFAIFMGADDAAYNRNRVAAEWGEILGRLQESDPSGYHHKIRIYSGLGHWMNGRDAEALPWMNSFVRDPWPSRIVWRQSSVVHHRFYWLALPIDEGSAGQTLDVSVEGQTITVKSAEKVSRLILRLSDDLLDLDQPVRVIHENKPLFEGLVERTFAAIASSYAERCDPHSVATALLILDL